MLVVQRPSLICPRNTETHFTLRQRGCFASHATSKTQPLSIFPRTYEEVIRQAQDATRQALGDDCTLLEIEFPTVGLASVSGDADGASEMNYSMSYLRRYCRIFEILGKTEATRIFFPEEAELKIAIEGRAMDPAAGGAQLDPVFEDVRFQLDFLMKPTPLMDIGIDINKQPMSEKISETDELFVMAYPHFNVDEILCVEELWRCMSEDKRPIIVFNGELDRIRTGYYPSLLYPKIGRISKSFIPRFTQVYYIHNFKGSHPGALFRCYPEPWQVLKRDRQRIDQLEVVQTTKEMPSLKEIALKILPFA